MGTLKMGDYVFWGVALGVVLLASSVLVSHAGFSEGGVDSTSPITHTAEPGVLRTVPNAHSVVWSKTENVQLCSSGIEWRCLIQIKDPVISIQYHARVLNADTGDVIACGSTVPENTNLQLEFVPETYRDIAWFAAGWSEDSPYGSWRSGASAPAISCDINDYLSTATVNYAGGAEVKTYAPLSVNPPTKSIGGIAGWTCTQPGADGAITCVANTQGTKNIVFNFGATYGKFYGRYSYAAGGRSCMSQNDAMRIFPGPAFTWGHRDPYAGRPFVMPEIAGMQDYQLAVPSQQIECPITVGNQTTITGGPTVSVQGGLTCTTHQEYSITMSGTDGSGTSIRYGIDWDTDGVVDQFVPGTGYVPSGTTQSASRIFTTAGNKTIRVRAQNSNGVDSAWATYSVGCVDETILPGRPSISPTSACFIGEPLAFNVVSSHPQNKNLFYEIDWGADGTIDLRKPASGFVAPGVAQNIVHTWNADRYTVRARAVDTDGGASPWSTANGICLNRGLTCVSCSVTTGDLDIAAQPVLVTRGSTSVISWTLPPQNVTDACSIEATNGDSWSFGTLLAQTESVSGPITEETRYTLSCRLLDGAVLTDSAVVSVVPTWEEI